jgi:hypothetical protein
MIGNATSFPNVVSNNGFGNSFPTNPTYTSGIYVAEGAAVNAISNNIVGFDISGTKNVGNAGTGVWIDSTAGRENSIGGTKATGNVIGWNNGFGISLGVKTNEDWNYIGVTTALAKANNKAGAIPGGQQGLGGDDKSQ